ncbi:MAG: sulfatase-like hydrolase/transferase [Acidobacteria bacterium]|nr:sulfatase-like hydrolase/transferase [Acidobacteriota bacterium]
MTPHLSRRAFLGLAAAGWAACGRSAPDPKQRPNVLFVAVDDLRPDLGCYGHPVVKTPHIDRLASQGLLFRRAYCQQAVCCPSRTSVITGLRPDSTGVHNNAVFYRAVAPDVVTLPQHFMAHGYFAQSLGKIIHGKMDDPASWSVPAWPEGGVHAGMQYIDLEGLEALRAAHPDTPLEELEIPVSTWKKKSSWQAPDVPDSALQDGETADRAIAALEGFGDRPFFLAVGFQKPHLPFTAPKRYWDLYSPDEVTAAANPQRPEGAPELAFTDWAELRGYKDIPREGPLPPGKERELRHGYLAATSYTDAQIGRVLAAVDRLGLADNTVVVLWGDHGYHLGEQDQWAKDTNFELDARVPLILRTPGGVRGAQTDALVELVDLYPTLSEACGLPLRPENESCSFLPLATDPSREWKSAAFSQFPRPWSNATVWEQMGYSLRTDRYRYTEWVDRQRKVVARELYDHRQDPAETLNIAERPDAAEAVAACSKQLAAGWRAALPESA